MSDLTDNVMQFEDMAVKKLGKKPLTGIARKKTKTIKKEKEITMSDNSFTKAKADHKAAIAKIKAQRAQLKQDIKKHKLLVKQAKIAYQLNKMKETK